MDGWFGGVTEAELFSPPNDLHQSIIKQLTAVLGSFFPGSCMPKSAVLLDSLWASYARHAANHFGCIGGGAYRSVLKQSHVH
jgi:hypothetical protein